MNRYAFLWMPLLAGVFTLVGCEQNASGDGAVISSSGYDERIDAELAKVETLMTRLKAQATTMAAEAKAELEAALSDLEQAREKLRIARDEFLAATADEAENLRAALDQALEDLAGAYDEVVSKYR